MPLLPDFDESRGDWAVGSSEIDPLACVGAEHLYRAMDFLEADKEQVGKGIFFRTADLMKAEVDLILYDTTSLHMEVEEEAGLQTG